MTGATFNFGAHACARDGSSAFLFDSEVKRGLFSHQPGACVQKLQYQFWRLHSGGRWLFYVCAGLIGVSWSRNRGGGSRLRYCQLEFATADGFQNCAVLFINAKLQRLLGVIGQREEVVVIIRAAMEHAALVVDGGINQGVSCAAIFGLHMKCVRSEFEIGIMPENHHLPLCPL